MNVLQHWQAAAMYASRAEGWSATHHNDPEHHSKDGADSHVESYHDKDQGGPLLQQTV